MSADVETVVIGAGVIGLAVARALTVAGHEVVVLERHARIGSETSSRNSEVIHAGIYYLPASLKAKLCVAGKAQLYRFAEENGVAANRCGKLLVATRDDEIAKLEALAANAARNGVSDLVRLSGDAAQKLEPEVRCVAAYLSPSTGVIDSHGFMLALEGHVTNRGGQVVLNTSVTHIRRKERGDFAIDTQSGGAGQTISARHLVNAAGLSATDVTRMLPADDAYQPPETYFAKGHYFALSGRAPFRHLVYPMPEPAGLGVHLTFDMSGRAKFGPDVEWTESVSYGFEDADGARRSVFERKIRCYWPGLPDGALQPDYVGFRPKIAKAGEPPGDFAIHGPADHGIPRFVALYGIESPGLTASLAIGDHVAALLA